MLVVQQKLLVIENNLFIDVWFFSFIGDFRSIAILQKSIKRHYS